MKGSKFVQTETKEEYEDKPLVPFYISFKQSYNKEVSADDPTLDIAKNKIIVYGPYKKEDAEKIFNEIVLYFRSFSTGVEVSPSDPLPGLTQYLKPEIWSGRKDYRPFFQLNSYSYGEFIAVLDDPDSWSEQEMTHFSFELFSDNPDWKKVDKGWEIIPFSLGPYGQGDFIPLKAPMWLYLWRSELLRPNYWKFPVIAGSFNKEEEITVIRVEKRRAGFRGQQMMRNMARGRPHDPNKIVGATITLEGTNPQDLRNYRKVEAILRKEESKLRLFGKMFLWKNLYQSRRKAGFWEAQWTIQ